jgi:hypothetical protein
MGLCIIKKPTGNDCTEAAPLVLGRYAQRVELVLDIYGTSIALVASSVHAYSPRGNTFANIDP